MRLELVGVETTEEDTHGRGRKEGGGWRRKGVNLIGEGRFEDELLLGGCVAEERVRRTEEGELDVVID
jgi:hypothetical protein